MAGNLVDDALASAKSALSHADDMERLTRPSPTPVPEGLKPVAKTEPPKHEYSNAPYSVAKEANDAGKALKSRMDMESKARQALK